LTKKRGKKGRKKGRKKKRGREEKKEDSLLAIHHPNFSKILCPSIVAT